MEKKKSRISVLSNCVILAMFAAIALASSSSREAVETMDGFVDGYKYGRSLTSDASEEIEVVNVDSVSVDQPLVATIK